MGESYHLGRPKPRDRRPKKPAKRVHVKPEELRTNDQEFRYTPEQVSAITGIKTKNLRTNYLMVAGDGEQMFDKRKIRAVRVGTGNKLVVLESELFRWFRFHGIDPKGVGGLPTQVRVYTLPEVAARLHRNLVALRSSPNVYYEGLQEQEPYHRGMLFVHNIHANGGRSKRDRAWRVSEYELMRWCEVTGQEVWPE